VGHAPGQQSVFCEITCQVDPVVLGGKLKKCAIIRTWLNLVRSVRTLFNDTGLGTRELKLQLSREGFNESWCPLIGDGDGLGP
jgi:hypothetical protein